tara:strand:- start:2432 stop:3505 length:1074 start_codon:yes stop_codon:yes gene_type:complete
MFNKNSFLLVSILFIVSCGGGGGGGGSSASPVQSYSYDKTTSDFTSKTWQVDAASRTIRDTRYEWSWDNYASWYPSWSENGIDIDFVENADYLTINIGYELANYSIQLSEIDSNIEPLYDPSGNLIAAIAQNNYSDATLRSFFFFPDYLAELNIEHTNVGFLDLFLGGQDRDTFALNYGSKTYTGDMPTTGSANYGIFGEGILTQYFSSSSSNSFVTRGDGNLTANFNSNKITGSLSFRSFYSYDRFLQYGATSDSQVLNAPVFTINFTEKTYNENGQTWSLGSISGNSFDNYLTLSSSGGFGFVGDGVAGGSFFGPDGKEISGTLLIVADEDSDQTGLFDWDIVGVFYGTCKPSGC